MSILDMMSKQVADELAAALMSVVRAIPNDENLANYIPEMEQADEAIRHYQQEIADKVNGQIQEYVIESLRHNL